MDPDWVDLFPIENGDFPASYVIVYQRVKNLFVLTGPWHQAGWKYRTRGRIYYPLVNDHIAGWKIPIFNRQYIDSIRGPHFPASYVSWWCSHVSCFFVTLVINVQTHRLWIRRMRCVYTSAITDTEPPATCGNSRHHRPTHRPQIGCIHTRQGFGNYLMKTPDIPWKLNS